MLQLDRTLDPLQENLINFSYDTELFVVGKLLVPSNSFSFNSSGKVETTLQTLLRIQTYPVPDSVLDSVLNEISE